MSEPHVKAVCFALAEYEHALSRGDADFRVVAGSMAKILTNAENGVSIPVARLAEELTALRSQRDLALAAETRAQHETARLARELSVMRERADRLVMPPMVRVAITDALWFAYERLGEKTPADVRAWLEAQREAE